MIRRIAAETSLLARRPFSAEMVLHTEILGQPLVLSITARRELRRAFPDGGEEQLIRRILDHLRPGDTVFDVGANVGVYTCLLAAHPAGGGCQLHAFEPAPKNHAQLVRNVALNRLGQRIDTHLLAVADTEGEIDLFLRGGAGEGRHSTVDRERSGEAVRVPVTTLATFCSRVGTRPDVLKIDVEGAEGRVLAGATALVDSMPPREIFLEIHPRGERDRMPDGETITRWLGARGYRRSWSLPQQAGRHEHYRRV